MVFVDHAIPIDFGLAKYVLVGRWKRWDPKELSPHWRPIPDFWAGSILVDAYQRDRLFRDRLRDLVHQEQPMGALHLRSHWAEERRWVDYLREKACQDSFGDFHLFEDTFRPVGPVSPHIEPPPLAKPESTPTEWLRLAIEDEEGERVAEWCYEAALSDGRRQRGRSSNNGTASFSQLPAGGNAEVTFPEDKIADWKRWS